jgi:hypothetical protein
MGEGGLVAEFDRDSAGARHKALLGVLTLGRAG